MPDDFVAGEQDRFGATAGITNIAATTPATAPARGQGSASRCNDVAEWSPDTRRWEADAPSARR
jgi:hypothetical protein